MGLNAGMASALALTGATKLAEAETSPTKPTYIIKDLGELVDW
jgi:ribonucleotide monophosphatase NagD (HAD superfamily)